MKPDLRRAGALARVPLIAATAGLFVAGAGGGQAFWLCLPLALLAAAPAHGWPAAAAGAALVTVAGSVPAYAGAGLTSRPNPVFVLLVVGGSVGVLLGLRARLSTDREAMRKWALTDPLTGAANRRGLAAVIDYEVSRHARQHRCFAVVMIDLDGFKAVNDRFGHHAGDELLRDVATSLGEAVRDQDTVARLGGDEFCVLAPETDDIGGAQLAERVSVAVGRVTTGLDSLSASVGVAVYPEDGTSAAAVLEAADDAQVAEKRARGHGTRRVARIAA
jgi:diguanylate cyclase (GGDEF)-like protein